MSIPFLRVTLHEPFSVTLAEMASTGAVWRVARESSDQLTLLDEGLLTVEEARAQQEAQVVCGGTHERTFQFQAHSPGTHRLSMVCDRPWLHPDPEAQRFAWDVKVH